MKQDFIVKFSTTPDNRLRVAVLAANPAGEAHAIESPTLDPYDADPQQTMRDHIVPMVVRELARKLQERVLEELGKETKWVPNPAYNSASHERGADGHFYLREGFEVWPDGAAHCKECGLTAGDHLSNCSKWGGKV
jgi:predicted alpha/beta hydrolase family esterase